MGHIVTSPLREVASLEEARTIAGRLFAADAVVPFTPVFFQASFGPIAVYKSGLIREAMYIGRGGLTWVEAL